MTTTSDMSSCEKYQQELGADPHYAVDPEHLAGCMACRAFQEDMQVLDAELLRALSVRVPALTLPELPDLPNLDTGTVSRLPRRGLGRPAWLAIAASVAVAVALGLILTGNESPSPTLAEQIVSHFENEQFAMRVTDQAVSDDRMARIIPANLATMDKGIGLVSYAQSCVINGKPVPHLVVQGEHGPVTILLLPGEKVDAPQKLKSGAFSGALFPVGNGSIAIVGPAGEDLQQMQQRVTSSVNWRT
jgi:hypothetical protein